MTHWRFAVLCAAALLPAASLAVLQPAAPKAEAPALPSVWLEELTWLEVRDALKAGVTTVIIPTGGVEQNGPHLALGKHNPIVRLAAEKIAARLGKTLVAPVVTYVPEGQHMKYAGTISLREKTFEALLEDTVRSLREHGFNRIILIGDSGGNYMVQQRLAERLHKEWRGMEAQIIHAGAYYMAQKQQVDWLVKQGHDKKAAEGHAALADTSELLLTAPHMVRAPLMARTPGDGSTGDASKASAELGKVLLEMKVEAAVKEIQAAQ